MIEGMDRLLGKLNKLEKFSLEEAVAKGIQSVQEDAKDRCRAVSGELRESIRTSVNSMEGRSVGVCYTNKEYAPYVEFGTGQKGQENHSNISPNIPVAYRQTPWWIHESMVDKDTAEMYHWFSIHTDEGTFYQVTGQPARPFMYPAMKKNEEHIKELIMEAVKEELK